MVAVDVGIVVDLPPDRSVHDAALRHYDGALHGSEWGFMCMARHGVSEHTDVVQLRREVRELRENATGGIGSAAGPNTLPTRLLPARESSSLAV